MASFNVPSSPVINTLILNNFLGVDFTTEISDVNDKRSPDSYNMINVDGYLQKRYGYKLEKQFENKINGIWNVDTINGDVNIIHSGTKLYEVDIDFNLSVEIFAGINDNISRGLVFENKLIIFDGKRVVVYYKENNSMIVKYLDEIGYIPMTRISMSPEFGGGVKYEDINLIQSKRINSFLGTNDDLEYKLDSDIVDSNEVKVEVLNANAEYDILVENEDFTVDRTKGKIIFLVAPGESLVEGRDNVLVHFSVSNEENLKQINECTIFTTFGYNGNNNRLFVSGNKKYPNIDWHSEIANPLYFPAENITAIGLDTSPVISYARVNDGKLAILKDNSDTDNTIFYKSSALFSGKEVFPLTSGIKGVGCITSGATANVQNESFILSNEGIYSILALNEYNQNTYNLKSYFINGKLTHENNLKDAVGIYYDGKYYLAVNGNVYIADTRYKSTEKDSKTSGYQYEWYFWNNIPVRIWFIWNNELYFGTTDGKICRFKNSKDKDLFKDIDEYVSAKWTTPMLHFNNIINAKTVKGIVVAHNPKVDSEIEVAYINKKGTKIILSEIYDIEGTTYPKVLQINKKLKKFMFMQLELFSNNDVNMSFVHVAIKYIIAGKYRGD